MKERIIKTIPRSKSSPYLFCSLSKHNIAKGSCIHRLVALVFIPNTDNKDTVNHINGIKTDNRLENLEWCTSRENTVHSKLASNKQSKYTGVSPVSKSTKRWVATISKGKNKITIGSFSSEELASAAYLEKMKEMGIENKYAVTV